MTAKQKEFFEIEFQPIGRRVKIQPGENLLDAARKAGIGLVALCGGEGWCTSCQVRIREGKIPSPSHKELQHLGDDKLAQGLRLACQIYPEQDLLIDLPLESLSTPQRLQVEGQQVDIPVQPGIQSLDVTLSAPTLEDLRSDSVRLKEALTDQGLHDPQIPFPVLGNLSGQLRNNRWKIRVVIRDGEVITILPQGSRPYGVAVDIGTTKLAIYLADLETGQLLYRSGAMNPQIAFGEDVISRISYAIQHEGGRKELQRQVIDVLNEKISDCCRELEITPEQLVDCVVVGNTAMHHFFSGLPVEQLVHAPYVPAVSDALDIRAADLNLNLAGAAYVHLLPNIAGYVGADHAAVLLSTNLGKTEQTVLVVDIGTNTEISLAVGGQLFSCSCASGPAFEGAHIQHGMRAAAGAIERMKIEEGQLHLKTIHDKLPVGICGSGILDIVAELKKAQLIDDRGVIKGGSENVRLGPNGLLEYILVPSAETGHGEDMTISRKDINEIQLAKAAIRAGQEILLDRAGISPNDIDEILIAGAFGTYLDVSNALEIGMFPPLPLTSFRQIGNAAGMGALQALLSSDHRSAIQDVVAQTHYVELTTSEEFMEIFAQAMYLR